LDGDVTRYAFGLQGETAINATPLAIYLLFHKQSKFVKGLDLIKTDPIACDKRRIVSRRAGGPGCVQTGHEYDPIGISGNDA
jgi:hypothetical protein